MANPKQPSTPMRNPTTPLTKVIGGAIINTRSPIANVAEQVAAAHKQADDELAHRLALNVLGDPGDPLANKINSIIPERVTRQGERYTNPAHNTGKKDVPG